MLSWHGALISISLSLSGLTLPAPGPHSETPFSLPVGSKHVSSITEEDFYRVPNEIRALYQEEVAATGATLVMDLNWKNPYFGAGCNLIDNSFIVMIWGGFARVPGMTLDSLALVACHELGHRLGGIPRQDAPLPEWSSSEGQADYFAASRCLKKYFSRQDSIEAVSKINVDRNVRTRCMAAFSDDQDAALCMRIATAAKSFIDVTESLTTEPHRVSFSKPDRTIVQTPLKNNYPSAQCRLDTFLAGALSDESSDLRPACWFKTQFPLETRSGSQNN